nr:hypothetical protein [Tanacetum cinerariifolium]
SVATQGESSSRLTANEKDHPNLCSSLDQVLADQVMKKKERLCVLTIKRPAHEADVLLDCSKLKKRDTNLILSG